jgi:hypothetical protein
MSDLTPAPQWLSHSQPYLAPYLSSKDLFRTCPPPSSYMFSLSALSQVKSQGQDISDTQAGFQTRLLDISGPRPEHVRMPDTPTARFPWGAIKVPPYLSSLVGHSFQLVNTLRYSLELSTSLLQASFKSKLPKRDLSPTLE